MHSLLELASQTGQFVNGSTIFKDKDFKIAHANFGVIIFQDFASASLQNEAFDLQTDWPVLANGKHSKHLILFS